MKASVRGRDRAATSGARLADAMIARADLARDAGRHGDAAALYQEALRIAPGRAPIHVQCGHMFKEAGDLDAAERHYLAARRLAPDDADLALQLGHFYKVAGRVDESAAAYRRALELQPGWAEAAGELAHLQQGGWRGGAAAAGSDPLDFSRDAERIALVAGAGPLVPEIVPRAPEEMLVAHGESVCLRRVGRLDRSPWGRLATLRGVEAIRGFCISAVPIVELTVHLGPLLIHRGPVKGGYILHYERDDPRLRKYVFNVWHDFTAYARGRHDLELRFVDAQGGRRTHREPVVVAEPLLEAEHPNSDGVVTLDAGAGQSVDAAVSARPSVVRPAKRTTLPDPIRNVLIVRTDQLGDMVTSIPAMRRLRELLPEARFVGLLTSSNAEFAATLRQLDEIIVIDFPDDKIDRKRTMPLAAQEELRRRLAPYQFDLALDLAESSMSRPLLLLAGAKFLYGFYDREWPFLTAGFEGNSHDPKNWGEIAPHSTRVLAFVERLGAMLDSRASVMRRPELSRDRLDAYGIGAGERYAVLHAGARIEFSRWPHYGALASMLLARTDMRVVLVSEEPETRAALAPELLAEARFTLLDRRLPFDDFDALLSFCDLFVGNDSGPKHLASLRGVNVVSIHSARINWSEWGQELVGSIVTRKVPCAGCALYHDADECGRDYVCVTGITPQEVFDAAMKLL